MASTYDERGVDDSYLEHRKLKRGAAGWVLLAGLGVSYVISGDFAGWNFGLDEGGWGGLLIATLLMGLMYTCMVFGLAEMSSALPVAGAGYGFARRAMGPLGGFATGMAVLIEYAVAPAAIAVFIGGYVEALGLFGLTSGWLVFAIAYLVFIGIHLYGVGEALKLMFAITAIAVVALVAALVGLLPSFSTSNMLDIAPTGAAGASDFLPMGFAGVVAALVYGIWFFLAVEGVPLAAEETDNPARDMPRGIIAAMLTLLLFAALILFILPGSAGSETIRASDNPLPEAIRAVRGEDSLLADFVNWAGLAGLVASFFSIIYAYSRQLFALSRAGYLPRVMSLTSSRKTPWVALLVPGTIGFVLAGVLEANMGADAGALLINIAVFGATVSYVLLNLSHILLRRREPDLERPYRTPGGVVTTGVALVLSVVAVVATFFVDERAAGITAGVFVLALAYFWFYSRHHLVASAPEEEFAAIESGESDLH
ncbi:ethanolamine permease [Nocardioides aurantiacus]|uniref:Ethanolamine:proton symporter (EAT family) n=1 Tax=Nocardioides aurantiacus TaxID=86796 RepID=A0A3N2CZP9_9ACTN|nr:ethanolamine permease [Nocardioides aurantiacus]ROR92976.1 ethanolamine:proton symporter (EAT family) [Nocardioides aurantiacus]